MAAASLLACSIPCSLGLIHATASAQGVATESQLETVTVKSSRKALSALLPSNTASKTSQELKRQNLFNPEDALEHVPGLTVRKRYFGDRNSNIGGRTYGVLQPGRALVYADGYLISNFLGRFDAPRWNMRNHPPAEPGAFDL